MQTLLNTSLTTLDMPIFFDILMIIELIIEANVTKDIL
jgi:hypothetical protein